MQLILRRLWIQITSDRKQFVALCSAMGIGLLLWARLILVANMPRTAIADPKMNLPEPVVATTQVPDKHRAPALPVVLSRQPDRDPFGINDSYFPKPTPIQHLNEQAGKFDPNPAENPEQAYARRTAELRALVERFQLEAVISGGPLAVISGRTYRLGDRIPGENKEQIRFSLVEIRTRSVIVMCEDRKYELKMMTPGG